MDIDCVGEQSNMSDDSDLTGSDDEADDEENVIKKLAEGDEDGLYILDAAKIVQGKRFAKMVIHGRPRPLKRYKMGRGKRKFGKMNSYNPSTKLQEVMKRQVQKAMKLIQKPTLELITTSKTLHISVDFYLRRPNTHFVRNNRRNERKNQSPDLYPMVHTSDIDNLVKFVLDVLQRSKMIKSDMWVVDLNAKKYLTRGADDGRTEITVEHLN